MGKKLVDVEDLVVWAASELARKRPNSTGKVYHLDIPRRDRECVGRWHAPMGYPPMSPMFARGLGQAGGGRGEPPHDDALIVEAAVERLRTTAPPCRLGAADISDGIGLPVDAGAALAAALGNCANWLLVHGRLGNRPAVRVEPPEPGPKLAPNGKPGVWRRERWDEPTFDDHARAERDVEVACVAKRKDLYPAGAYGVVEWSPAAQTIVVERAEYAAWRAGLEWLAGEMSGALASRTALPPRAALRPWAGERDGEPVADLFRPGAEGVYGGDAAASLAAERRAGRRRPIAGGTVYGLGPGKPGRGAREA